MAMGRVRLVLIVFGSALLAAACKEDGTVRVRSLKFDGVHAVDISVLKSALATREDRNIPIIGWQVPWARSRSGFDRGRFDADLQRIQAFYADRGYPDAKVTNFDVKLNTKQDAVDVTLTIDEGDPVNVVNVNLEGFEILPPSHLTSLQRRLPLRVGRPRDRQGVLAAHQMALNELRDHGYPYARVDTRENDGPSGKNAAITFVAEPGVLARFGPIEIVGNKSVGEAVIRRQVTIEPGALYRRSQVQDTQRRLYSMELFQFVNVEALEPEKQAASVPMRVTVAEGKHQRVNGGVGYGTEEKARIEGEYRHVNFLGGARSAGAHARWSSLDRGIRLNFNQPYVFMPKLSLGGEGQRWYTYTPAYRSVVTGGKVSLTHRESAQTAWSLSMTSERSSSSILLDDPLLYNDLIALGLDPTTRTQEGTLRTMAFDIQRTTTDSVLNARRGYQFAAHVEGAGGPLPGTFNYFAVSADTRHYLPLSRNLVVANRVQLGNIRAAEHDPKEVPFSRRYFLGGATTLRGWGRYEVSPLGSSGLPIGGSSLFLFSSELRARLQGNLGGVLFLDTGAVWADQRYIDFGALRYSVGPGLRYQTPVGPIRFDLGYQLNPVDGLVVNGRPQLRRWRLHFSIGQAF